MFTRLRDKRAFTLVEIMIVVAIIGLLIAIALPNFVKARENTRRGLCANNIRLIGNAVEQEMINAGDTTPPTELNTTTLGTYIKGGYPACPSAGTYDIATGVISCSLGNQSQAHNATYDVSMQ